MSKKRGSVLYYVTAMAGALGFVVIAILRITQASSSEVSRAETHDRADAAFTAAIAPIRDAARKRTLTVPSTATYTAPDGTVVSATATSNPSLPDSRRVDLVAVRDAKTYRRTEYVGVSKAPIPAISLPADPQGLMMQSGDWPSWSWPSWNGYTYTEPKVNPSTMPNYYMRSASPNWQQTTVNASPTGVDGFWCDFHGQILAPVSGNYTFTTYTDDGYQLWVNTTLIIDKWFPQGTTRYDSVPIYLNAGSWYSIRVKWFDFGGASAIGLRWSYPGQGEVVVPDANLRPGNRYTEIHPVTYQSSVGYSFPLSPTAEFEYNYSNPYVASDPPLIIDLVSLGFSPGQSVRLGAVGMHDWGPNNGGYNPVGRARGKFSSSGRYDRNQQSTGNRVTDSIGNTFVIASKTTGGTVVTIPANGRYLFLKPDDTGSWNNSFVANGIFNVTVEAP
jgi:PA14 domain